MTNTKNNQMFINIPLADYNKLLVQRDMLKAISIVVARYATKPTISILDCVVLLNKRVLDLNKKARKGPTIRDLETKAGLLDRDNLDKRVKWVNSLRNIVGLKLPKNKSGAALVSDVDLILASDEDRLAALEKLK